MNFCRPKALKKLQRYSLFSARRTNSFGTISQIILCTTSVIFLECRSCMKFCVAMTCSSTVFRKNKDAIKEELLKSLRPQKVVSWKHSLHMCMKIVIFSIKLMPDWLISGKQMQTCLNSAMYLAKMGTESYPCM